MRNRTLDMVKAICAYAVVLLHVHFPGNAGIIANVLARFAVPVFFMVSGYFCFRGDDTEFIRTGKKIRHVLKLMLVAFPVCCLWELIQNHIDGASQKEWLEALVSGEHVRQRKNNVNVGKKQKRIFKTMLQRENENPRKALFYKGFRPVLRLCKKN